MIGRLLALLRRPTGRCFCDRRFLGIAHDIDCPVHGITAEIGVRK